MGPSNKEKKRGKKGTRAVEKGPWTRGVDKQTPREHGPFISEGSIISNRLRVSHSLERVRTIKAFRTREKAKTDFHHRNKKKNRRKVKRKKILDCTASALSLKKKENQNAHDGGEEYCQRNGRCQNLLKKRGRSNDTCTRGCKKRGKRRNGVGNHGCAINQKTH